MNNQPRTPAPTPARASTPVRGSTLRKTSIQVRTPTPGPESGPTRITTLVRTPALIRTLTPIRTPTPVRTPTPAPPSTPVRTPTPARTPTPVPPSTPLRPPTPVRPPTPIRPPTPVRPPTPIRPPTPVRPPTPIGTPTLIRSPTPVQIPTPDPIPTLIPSRVLISALESLPDSPSGPPLELEPTLTVSPAKKLEPTPRVKQVSSAASGFPPIQEPLPALTPLATDLPSPSRGSPLRTDPSTTKLIASSGHVPGTPILGAIQAILPVPALASISGSLKAENKIMIQVVYCYSLRYILLRKSLEQQFPNSLIFEEEISAQATGEFEVFVDGKLVHSKKNGDGFVDEAKLQTIVNLLNEEFKKRVAGN